MNIDLNIGAIPSGLSFFCALLTVCIPVVISLIHAKLHKLGDPPWKKNSDPDQ
ncbi:hypothetical protein [Paenibacillus sp. LHD-38]|uniref:hypothetical protein n=1 Tax=Paenibacillus sp. LHD-38 TaxID=3072143 RepID=UPI00280DCFE1|nr:hypothetical protein [Paenibacillus sp. LHD-38]MDQ8739400.1 hypothetical protein [Paenibacillus sp. LHD-38]